MHRFASYILLASALSSIFLFASASAYFNMTYLNTTVILYKNTSAHVVESFTIFMSNSSISQYNQDRRAINLTLSEWQHALSNDYLMEHIINPRGSVRDVTFLPGPIGYTNNYGGTAIITLDYWVNNVTNVQNIAPREFEYTFNDSVLNFQHTSSGEDLPPNTRFNIIIPKGTDAISVYPSPDFPNPSFTGNYTGHVLFSWFESEPLNKFTFAYTQQQSMQAEVLAYFTGIYYSYTAEIYLAVIVAAAAVGIYAYRKLR